MAVDSRGRLVGIGIDSVDVARMASVIARRPAIRTKVWTDAERAYTDRLRDPVPSLAARFAAKEAVMKALGVGLGAFDFHDVEVVRCAGGRPELAVGGRAAELARRAGVGGWAMSITHTSTVASAVVAALA